MTVISVALGLTILKCFFLITYAYAAICSILFYISACKHTCKCNMFGNNCRKNSTLQ